MQAVQRFFHALLPVPAVMSLDLGLQRIQIDTRSAGEILLTPDHHFAHALGRRLEDGGFGIQVGFLRHIGGAQALLHMQRAVVRLGGAGQNLEQRGFARAIAANQANALGSLQCKVCMIEQGNMSKGQLRI